jgi:hypothetical protein
MDRAGNGTGNDDFAWLSHELSIPVKCEFLFGDWTSVSILVISRAEVTCAGHFYLRMR